MKFKYTKVDLTYPDLPEDLEGFSMLQLGDLHTQGWQWKEQCVKKVLDEGADLILCTGDFCFNRSLPNPFCFSSAVDSAAVQYGLSWRGFVFPSDCEMSLAVIKRLFADVDPQWGTYVIQGNHDPDAVMQKLPGLGMVVLENETCQIKVKDSVVNIAGMKGFDRHDVDLPQTWIKRQPHCFTICLCHYPEFAEPIAAAGVELTLAGHTHGGQICFPDGTPILTHSRTGRKFAKGLWPVGKGYIYTTRGIGYSTLSIRLFCDPEMVRLTLHKGEYNRSTETEAVVSPS